MENLSKILKTAKSYEDLMFIEVYFFVLDKKYEGIIYQVTTDEITVIIYKDGVMPSKNQIPQNSFTIAHKSNERDVSPNKWRKYRGE